MTEWIIAIFKIVAISFPMIVVIFLLSGVFDANSIKTKIKDFFYPKHQEDKKSDANYADPSTDDLSELRQKVKEKEAEIEYAEELVRIQKDIADKDLHLKRLYADEDEFETLYVVYKYRVYHGRDIEKIFQTKIEAEEYAQTLNEGGYSYGIVEEFKYLPNKEEE